MKLISSISFLIITIVLFFAVINPIYGDIQQLRTGVDSYNLALNNSTDLQKTRDSLVDIYKNIKQEDKDKLEHLLPSTIGNIELILEIEKIANLHGMPISDMRFETKQMDSSGTVVTANDPSSNLPYGIFPMQFTTTGNYDTFIAFLKDLEHNLRIIDVKSISFNSTSQTAGGTGPNDIYNYSLKVQTYWLK
jgi:Tfp pilus assembly protein PilO